MAITYTPWTGRELRALAKEFPDPVRIHWDKKFELTIQTYEPRFSYLCQLIELLVSESKAREWVEKAGWKHPLMDFASHHPEVCNECQELAQKLPDLIPELSPKIVDWAKIQQCKQKPDESIPDC